MQLDVRGIAPWERHPLIFAAFDAAQAGDALRVTVDHEPRPLQLQFEALRPGKFSWTAYNLGDRWEAAIVRLAVPEMEDDPKAILTRHPLLQGAALETRERLVAHAYPRRLARDQVLFTQGEEWPFLGIVAEGALALVASGEDGRETVLWEALPSQTVAAVSAIDGGTTLSTARVFSPRATIVLLPRDELVTAAATDPRFSHRLSIVAAQQTRAVSERLVAQISKSTRARIAAAILPYALPERGLVPVLPPLDSLTQAHLAATAGTVREVVARALGEFEAAGAIARAGGHVVRTDRARLSAFL